MNSFDVVLVAVLALAGALGALRGLVRTVFALGAWIVAGALAWMLAAPVAAAFGRSISEPTTRALAAFVLVFFAVLVLGVLAGRLLHRVIEATPVLKIPNRFLGALAGLAVGVVVVVIVFVLAGLTSLPQSGWWRHSALAPYMESLAGFLGEFLPADIARHIRYS